MATIIESNNRINPICAICYDGFAPGQRQYTHKGGENHDGFHKECMRQILNSNQEPLCPHDRLPLDPNGLKSRIEVITERVKPPLINAACTAHSILTLGGVLKTAQIASEIALGALRAAAGLSAPASSSMIKIALAAGIAEVEEEHVRITSSGTTAILAGTMVAMAATTALCVVSARSVVNRLAVDLTRRHSIGWGLFSGWAALAITYNIPLSAMVAAATAGVLSLVPR